MSDAADPRPDSEPESDGEKKKRKKQKDALKVRSAWISFAGRIAAQVVGALATVVLGLLVADRMRRPAETGGAAQSPAAAVAPAVRDASIAVLPLANLSGRPDQDYLADGLTEALITDLARIRSLKVISRTSVMQYKTAPKPVPEIGRELGVAYVLEGSITPGNGRIRVTAQLIDAATDRHVWTETYDRKTSDILALQDDVSRQIAREVNVVLTPDELAMFSRAKSVDPETHALYLLGRHELNDPGNGSPARAIGIFESVLSKDPKHAAALTGLSEAWARMGSSITGTTQPTEALPKAREAAERAVAADPDLADARVALAAVMYQNQRDFKGAETELRTALRLSPGNAAARRTMSLLLANLGRPDEAIAEARRVLELDPLSPQLRQSLAVTLYFAGRFDEALKEGRAAREGRDPKRGFPEFVAEVLLASGQPAAAIDEMKALFHGEPETDSARAIWGAAHAAAGDRSVATRILKDLRPQAASRYVSPRTLLILEVSLGLNDEAFATIDRAVREGSDLVHVMKVHPLLRPLRADPRFAAALRKAGFPEA